MDFNNSGTHRVLCHHARTDLRERPPHVGEYCSDCDAFIRWVPQTIDLEKAQSYVMPFGKHTGQMLKDIPIAYLSWLEENCQSKNVVRHVRAFLTGGANGN